MSTPPSAKSIGILLDRNLSLKRLLPFAQEAHTKGHKIIFLDMIYGSNRQQLPKFGSIETIANTDLRDRHEIDVLFVVDSLVLPPENCKIISIPHVHLEISPDNTDAESYYGYMNSLAKCDYLVLGHQNIRKFRGEEFTHILSLTPEEYHNQTKRSVIIPAGYPSLDILIEQTDIADLKQDCILYASAHSHILTEGESQNTLNILEKLAQKFPDKKIIFRPLPFAESRHEGTALFGKIKAENVALDLSDNNPELYARAALLVTDTSTTADTFSYATLRPHIQCQMHGFRKEMTHKRTGWVVYSINQLTELLDNIDLDSSEHKKHILKQRNLQFCSIGKTAAYIIDHLEIICVDSCAAGWIKVPHKTDRCLRNLTDEDFLQKLQALASGPRKAHWLICAIHYFWQKQFPVSYTDLIDWFTTHQPLSRLNAYNLPCFKISAKTLQIIDYSSVHSLNLEPTDIPFYLSCNKDESVTDFTFNKDFIDRTFAGYTGTDKAGADEYTPIQKIISRKENAYIAIGNTSMYSRMAAAVDLYCAARNAGIKTSSQATIHYTAVHITEDHSLKRLQAWECRAKSESGSFGPFMIWGTSGYYHQLKEAKVLPPMDSCIGFIDSNKQQQGNKVDGITVYSIQQALGNASKTFSIILAASHIYYEEIIATLREELARMNPNSTLAHPRKDGY